MKKRMKTIVVNFLFAIGLLLSFASCSDFALNDSDSAVQNSNQKFGSVTISQAGRALDISEIKFASITVTGTGIDTPITSESSVTDGVGDITINNIPIGKNRIVTVYALDSSKVQIQGIIMRAIVDIESGKTSNVSVTWDSTALGNVFKELLALNYNLETVSTSNIGSIKDVIDTDKSPLLINTSQIASDFKNNSLQTKSAYILSAASAKITYSNTNSFKIQVCDPFSTVTTGVSGVTTVSNIAPGTWNIYILDDSDNILKFKTLNVFTSGCTLDIDMSDVVYTDIIVHAKYQYIHSWQTGVDGTSSTMVEESDGWYGYTFEDTSTINLLFSSSNIINGDWSGKTSDLSLSECGEYWYEDGEWYDSNPDDTVKPVISSVVADKTGTVSGNVVFTIYATDNLSLSKVVVLIDETEVSSITLSGKSDSKTYTWNSATYRNGSHTVSFVVYDAAKNKSTSVEKTVETSNVNLTPVAIIKGATRATINSEKTYSATSSYDQTVGGSIVSYKWTITGATIKSGANSSECVVTMPSSETSVTLSLVVIDDEGASSTTVTKDITVVTKSESVDFRDETIYFLMTTRFYDGDSSNNRYCWDDESCFKSETLGDPGWRGDFKGLIEKLDYIKALGFSAIWITPVVENASGLDYHGYHAFDFSKVDPRYESNGVTYQDLIDACHEKGIKVIQDIVLNHTGNFGERGILNIMEKNYESDDGTHSVPVYANKAGKDIYGNSAYAKLSAGAKLQGYDTYDAIEASSLDDTTKGGKLYQSRLMTMKNDSIDLDSDGMLYHHYGVFQWESYYVQEGQMAGDCVDLNTENPAVAKYIRDCYINYIDMGVDAFRIDTMKHISRLTMNKEFIPYFQEAGGSNFFMFGEGCVLRNEVWNAGMPGISVPFYTWKANSSVDDSSYSWGANATDAAANLVMAKTHFDNNPESVQLTSNNAFLSGNAYHTPDYSKASGLQMIDFYMHHKFGSAGSAFGVASEEDRYFNDATYNVTYVDSHDYGPNEGGYLYMRYSGGTQAWADNFNLMFTFRGIPCVYYGSEIEFQKNKQIEPYTNGNKVPYAESGRAYYGDHLEGSVTASDYGEYTASGTVNDTLSSDLSQHLIRLNKIRRAIPALQKGQYSTENCSGSIAFKRRYTDSTNGIDSFACVTIGGQGTFTGIPGGTYVEVITGATKSIGEGGTITSDSIDEGNMRIYVLQSDITGKIGSDGTYLK